MIFIPKETETLVSPLSSQELLRKLGHMVHNSDETEESLTKGDQQVFTGTIEQNAFVLSLKLKRPDNFIPIIKGNIEDTSKGSIIFLKYTLFKSTRMFLIFWTTLIFILALALIIIQGKYWYASVALIASLANYMVTVINFKRKVKVSRGHLMKVFT